MAFAGGCETLSKKYGLDFNCCTSCHYDQDEGYGELLEFEDSEGWFAVCCSAKNAVDENLKTVNQER